MGCLFSSFSVALMQLPRTVAELTAFPDKKNIIKGGRDGRGNIRHCSVATKMVISDSTSYFATKTYHCVCSLAVHMLIGFQHLQCDRTRDYHLQNREANC